MSIKPLLNLITSLNKALDDLPSNRKGSATQNRRVQKAASDVFEQLSHTIKWDQVADNQEQRAFLDAEFSLRARFLEIKKQGGFKRYFFHSTTEKIVNRVCFRLQVNQENLNTRRTYLVHKMLGKGLCYGYSLCSFSPRTEKLSPDELMQAARVVQDDYLYNGLPGSSPSVLKNLQLKENPSLFPIHVNLNILKNSLLDIHHRKEFFKLSIKESATSYHAIAFSFKEGYFCDQNDWDLRLMQPKKRYFSSPEKLIEGFTKYIHDNYDGSLGFNIVPFESL